MDAIDWETPLLRVVASVARFRFVLFALLAAYLVGAGTGWSFEPHGIGGDWHYYADGGRALFGGSYGESGRGGVHLFADHPELTTGPLSLVVARGVLVLGADGWFAAHAAIARWAANQPFAPSRSSPRATTRLSGPVVSSGWSANKWTPPRPASP